MKQKKRALIFGVSGQDGSYLSRFLISQKNQVYGTTRNNNKRNLKNLISLEIVNKIKIFKCDIKNFYQVKKIIQKIKPHKIFYLCGQSSVTGSYTNPAEAFKSNTLGLLNILEIVKESNRKIKVFNAVSGQIYGNQKKNIYNEKSYIEPQSPYGVSKASSFWLTKIFREWYGVKCCSGILFNHESPLRSDEFVTKKIINNCKLIKKGKLKYLYMGDINIYRDWGWAPEYVNAIWLMLQQKKPIDLVIGSGKTHSLREFVNEVFKILKLNKKNVVTNTKKFYRKNDIKSYRANTFLAKKKIGWKAKTSFKQIIKKMIYDELF